MNNYIKMNISFIVYVNVDLIYICISRKYEDLVGKNLNTISWKAIFDNLKTMDILYGKC